MLSDALIGGLYFDRVVEILREGFPIFAGVIFSFVLIRLIYLAFFCEN